MSRSSSSGSRGESIHYRRNRFSTHLPVGYFYTRSHFWLNEATPGLWHVGLTRFATRMLGDIVEFDFEVTAGSHVEVASVVGWIEGFKAVSDLYCVADGEFIASNPDVVEDPSAIGARSYTAGWLYSVRGTRDPESVDVKGYIDHLDRTIDTMLEKPWQTPGAGEP